MSDRRPKLGAQYVAPGFHRGFRAEGNIDIAARPRVKNADGSVSTVRSMSVNLDNQEVLLPTVSDDGHVMSDNEAIETYRRTGSHLGIFDTAANANAYAEKLHQQQAETLKGAAKKRKLGWQ